MYKESTFSALLTERKLDLLAQMQIIVRLPRKIKTTHSLRNIGFTTVKLLLLRIQLCIDDKQRNKPLETSNGLFTKSSTSILVSLQMTGLQTHASCSDNSDRIKLLRDFSK